MDVLDPPPGRREANRQATRAAILDAARDLFKAKGYEATTVREIAERAEIGERTFYRYFEDKALLLDDEVDRWIAALQQAVRERPAREPPLQSVEHAIAALVGDIATGTLDSPTWLVADGPAPLQRLQRSVPRLLLRIEDAIAEALLARPDPPAPPDRFRMQLAARVSVAILRSVIIHRRTLLMQTPESAPPVTELLGTAFAQYASQQS